MSLCYLGLKTVTLTLGLDFRGKLDGHSRCLIPIWPARFRIHRWPRPLLGELRRWLVGMY